MSHRFKMEAVDTTWSLEFREAADDDVWFRIRRALYDHPDVRGVETIEDNRVVHVTVYGNANASKVCHMIEEALGEVI